MYRKRRNHTTNKEKNAEEESRIKVLLDNLEMKRLDLQKELEAILKVMCLQILLL